MEHPADLRYTASHEWLRDNGDGTVTVGITFHAQETLGELVYVELPEPGRRVAAGEPCAVVESTKAASDVYAPVTGEILEVNAALSGAPQTVNEAPYGDGWLFRMALSNPAEPASLMSALDYRDDPEAT